MKTKPTLISRCRFNIDHSIRE